MESFDSKIDQWLQHVKDVPRGLLTKALELTKSKFHKLESRYGRTEAIVIIGAFLAGLAVPLPAGSAIVAAPFVAFAELHRAFRAKFQPTQPDRDTALTEEQRQAVQQAADEVRAELAKEQVGSGALAEAIRNREADLCRPLREEEFRVLAHAYLTSSS